MAHDVTRRALKILDDDKLDREWVVRNMLGDMAVGFGSRVVLDTQPVFTTIIILTGYASSCVCFALCVPNCSSLCIRQGWAAKTFVAAAVSTRMNKEDLTRDVFLAYSIP
ncbi:uncharacterized protein FOMMEDRAFT_152052 [Fomitiporia mediterranea MF3/22]|uniref:uncharacterized protein n=1 Tax=Fomitiporia mediterranea (strain MF3/22) TaxID=694068 RepID=UPI00044093C8|nr:uncharacterized protein FOMMEDRAFT_152052 [Fomitiporia mediterranea MF3/22]EJD06746.1 hypothetical protein FOMMEDRAFT_152052 [Fomitiporia mediterranea MF3/22]